MSIPSAPSDDAAAEELPETIEREVLAHPSVVRLDGGRFGVVASYLADRRVIGVRVGMHGEPIELSVVLRLGRPIPDLVAELRTLVRAVAGNVAVDIAVSDLLSAEDVAAQGASSSGPAGHRSARAGVR